LVYYLPFMRTRIALCLAVLASFGLAEVSYAQQRAYDIMIEEGGRRPASKPTAKPAEPAADETKKPEAPKKQAKPRTAPRGSGYVPPANLPRTEAIVTPQAPGVYRPPPIDSFSDRVTRCNHSFPLNAGIGNNPTDRSAYVRQCAN
jgi:hypothetical protein